MKFEYQIQEQDYLDFQLYTATRSVRFEKKQRNGRYFITLCSLILACYFIYDQDWGMTAYFGLQTVVFFLFYPWYFKWRQKVHYTKYIRRNYKNLFGRSETLEVKGKTLHLVNSTGEGQIKAAELDQFIETKRHFFIEMKSGASLIIPIYEMSDADSLKRQINGMKIPVEKDLDWKW
ncbi:MAG: hypothetical protein ACI8ZM_003307 [Crocinitomix sp.]|jgi:hypothetical protein